MKLTIAKPIVHSREFFDNKNFSTLHITADCKKIEYKAFAFCTNLTSVIVEDSEDSIAIEFDAFRGCKNLVIFQTNRPVYFYKDVNLRR